MYMKQLKENALPFVTFVLVAAIVRHIVKYSRSTPKQRSDFFKNLEKGDYVAPTDLAFGLIYIIFIRNCCKHQLVKTAIFTFVLVYLGTFALAPPENMKYKAVFSLGSLKEISISSIAPVIAALTTCALIK